MLVVSGNIEINIRLFADDCITFREIMDSSDIERLQRDVNRSGEWRKEME